MFTPLSSDRLRRKLAVLADAAKYDASCASGGARRDGGAPAPGICHSYTPDGRCVSLLRILLTNACIYDCLFCVNRASSDIPRARFTPEEVVALTLEFFRRNYVEGLFLSSGIVGGSDHTMEQLVAVARMLRQQHAFPGYIHLKVVPGASPELLAAAGRYADRLSANIELPTQADLDLVAPEKAIARAEATMGEIASRHAAARDEKSAAAPAFAPAGQSTQLVVGATPSPDRTILDTATRLYRRHALRRVYYTAFSPIPHADPRLPPAAPPLAREHRLYQADWLLRHYGFSIEDLFAEGTSALPLDVDPKHAWALRNRGRFPVDVNRADRELLLRVPGLGVRTVERILEARRVRALRLDDLRRLSVPLVRARAFVVTADRNPGLAALDRAVVKPVQLSLFDVASSARSGEL